MQRSTIDSLLRATQAHCLQICEKITLDYGIVYSSRRFRSLPAANQFREVIAGTAENAAIAFDEVERHFHEQGLTCLRWAAAGGAFQPPMADFLVARGFAPRPQTAMVLTSWLPIDPTPLVRVLPGRAMRGMIEPLTRLRHPGGGAVADEATAAQLERMDNPQYDLFIALIDGRPSGQAALLQVGDAASVVDVFVAPDIAVQDVERALLHDVLALAKRLTMRHVFMPVDEADGNLRRRLNSLGFIEDGVIVEYARPGRAT